MPTLDYKHIRSRDNLDTIAISVFERDPEGDEQDEPWLKRKRNA